MSDYTPTTEQIRAVFMGGAANEEQGERRGNSFDRWLTAHDAEVRAGVVAEEPGWACCRHCMRDDGTRVADCTGEEDRHATPCRHGCNGVPVKQEGTGQ
ncbi:hypothetical protein [Microbacterium sp. K5D]|uniref:hypothetical protein n=1 Tax=Microbacterium sp. K5D TaxID=2305436 RepID=UPI00109C09FB|nr:hypothetical protein [Microbacterium sp. K5D]